MSQVRIVSEKLFNITNFQKLCQSIHLHNYFHVNFLKLKENTEISTFRISKLILIIF